MQSPNENVFDVLDDMRTRNFQPPYYQACVDDYADRIEKCVCDLVDEVKKAVNQAWYESLNSVTEEFDRRIRENFMEKALGMLGRNAHLTETDRIEKGAANDDGRQEDKRKEDDNG